MDGSSGHAVDTRDHGSTATRLPLCLALLCLVVKQGGGLQGKQEQISLFAHLHHTSLGSFPGSRCANSQT